MREVRTRAPVAPSARDYSGTYPIPIDFECRTSHLPRVDYRVSHTHSLTSLHALLEGTLLRRRTVGSKGLGAVELTPLLTFSSPSGLRAGGGVSAGRDREILNVPKKGLNDEMHATFGGPLRAPACPQTLIFGGTEKCHPPAQGNTRESACPYIPPPSGLPQIFGT